MDLCLIISPAASHKDASSRIAGPTVHCRTSCASAIVQDDLHKIKTLNFLKFRSPFGPAIYRCTKENPVRPFHNDSPNPWLCPSSKGCRSKSTLHQRVGPSMAAIGSLLFCTACGNLLPSSTGQEDVLIPCDVCGNHNRGRLILLYFVLKADAMA